MTLDSTCIIPCIALFSLQIPTEVKHFRRRIAFHSGTFRFIPITCYRKDSLVTLTEWFQVIVQDFLWRRLPTSLEAQCWVVGQDLWQNKYNLKKKTFESKYYSAIKQYRLYYNWMNNRSSFHIRHSCPEKEAATNSVDVDETLQKAASHQDLHCLV